MSKPINQRKETNTLKMQSSKKVSRLTRAMDHHLTQHKERGYYHEEQT